MCFEQDAPLGACKSSHATHKVPHVATGGLVWSERRNVKGTDVVRCHVEWVLLL